MLPAMQTAKGTGTSTSPPSPSTSSNKRQPHKPSIGRSNRSQDDDPEGACNTSSNRNFYNHRSSTVPYASHLAKADYDVITICSDTAVSSSATANAIATSSPGSIARVAVKPRYLNRPQTSAPLLAARSVKHCSRTGIKSSTSPNIVMAAKSCTGFGDQEQQEGLLEHHHHHHLKNGVVNGGGHHRKNSMHAVQSNGSLLSRSGGDGPRPGIDNDIKSDRDDIVDNSDVNDVEAGAAFSAVASRTMIGTTTTPIITPTPSSTLGVNMRVTGQCSQGGRKYMEDQFLVAYQKSPVTDDLEYAFFGIYDGHGGDEAALFAKEHLMLEIVKQKQFWSDKDEDVLRAIREGYIATHFAMWREQEKWPRTANGHLSTAGTTATVAFMRHEKIYIGHVGDSGIVLGYQKENETTWRAKQLTTDHKPESVEEKTRIQRAGGNVTVKSGVPRVVWNRPRDPFHRGPIKQRTPVDDIPFLAVARSLGDLWSYNSRCREFVVSPDPDVKVVKINPNTFRCLVFGTDGLWNVMTPQEAVDCVQEQLNMGEQDTMNPSKALVDQALKTWASKKMRADNTSVVTVILSPAEQAAPSNCAHSDANGSNHWLSEHPRSPGTTALRIDEYEHDTPYSALAQGHLPPELYRNYDYYEQEEPEEEQEEETDEEEQGAMVLVERSATRTTLVAHLEKDRVSSHSKYGRKLRLESRTVIGPTISSPWNVVHEEEPTVAVQHHSSISKELHDLRTLVEDIEDDDMNEGDEDEDDEEALEADRRNSSSGLGVLYSDMSVVNGVVAPTHYHPLPNCDAMAHIAAADSNSDDLTDLEHSFSTSYVSAATPAEGYSFAESYNSILNEQQAARTRVAFTTVPPEPAAHHQLQQSNVRSMQEILQEQQRYQQQEGYSLTRLETRREQQQQQQTVIAPIGDYEASPSPLMEQSQVEGSWPRGEYVSICAAVREQQQQQLLQLDALLQQERAEEQQVALEQRLLEQQQQQQQKQQQQLPAVVTICSIEALDQVEEDEPDVEQVDDIENIEEIEELEQIEEDESNYSEWTSSSLVTPMENDDGVELTALTEPSVAMEQDDDDQICAAPEEPTLQDNQVSSTLLTPPPTAENLNTAVLQFHETVAEIRKEDAHAVHFLIEQIQKLQEVDCTPVLATANVGVAIERAAAAATELQTPSSASTSKLKDEASSSSSSSPPLVRRRQMRRFRNVPNENHRQQSPSSSPNSQMQTRWRQKFKHTKTKSFITSSAAAIVAYGESQTARNNNNNNNLKTPSSGGSSGVARRSNNNNTNTSNSSTNAAKMMMTRRSQSVSLNAGSVVSKRQLRSSICNMDMTKRTLRTRNMPPPGTPTGAPNTPSGGSSGHSFARGTTTTAGTQTGGTRTARNSRRGHHDGQRVPEQQLMAVVASNRAAVEHRRCLRSNLVVATSGSSSSIGGVGGGSSNTGGFSKSTRLQCGGAIAARPPPSPKKLQAAAPTLAMAAVTELNKRWSLRSSSSNGHAHMTRRMLTGSGNGNHNNGRLMLTNMVSGGVGNAKDGLIEGSGGAAGQLVSSPLSTCYGSRTRHLTRKR
ncbi:uncharacterized protein LOC115627916 [Scaptodrosophila lebanonensis]|uniref:Uncharacterized protein LOC115627916 n=1 Tax=Drosophila lebanonensis TaxID=7225 RepID=A0A6J2TVU3_DROLE|nr:uncharacterized protein LOC115627916 [Scaptodrosophila lebanonensis]